MPLGKRIEKIEKTEKISNESNSSEKDEQTASMFQFEEPKYDFSDIILNDDTFSDIQDVLSIYEKRELLFDKWGLSTTHKNQNRVMINLYGFPGTGKTMVAHAISKQLKRNILTVDYSQIESKYVGETSKNLVSLFEYAKQTKSVIFFDEADALLSKRVTNMSNSTDVSVNQTRSVLLILINDYQDLIIFATNFVSNYDPAFMRRILSHIKFDLPNEKSRLKLWELYIPKALPTDVDKKLLASKYDNLSGSDISNAVFNASLKAAKKNESFVKHKYFEEAIERIQKSKEESNDVSFVKRTVSKDYVKTQFGGELPK